MSERGSAERQDRVPLSETQKEKASPDVAHIQDKTWNEIDQMLKERETYAVGKESLECIDTSPETKKTDVPMVLVPGFTETPTTFGATIWGLREKGRRVLMVCNYHGLPAEKQNFGQEPQLRKAQALLEMLKQKNLDQVDAVGHSEGSVVIALAAKIEPKRFRNIVLYNPAGMYDRNENVVAIAGRWALSLLQEQFDIRFKKHTPTQWEMRKRSTGELGGYMQEPTKVIAEAVALGSARMDHTIKELQEKHGIGVSLLASKNDVLFPLYRRMPKVLREAGIPAHHAKVISGIHPTHIRDHDVVTNAIDELLDQMEQEKGAPNIAKD